jgi:hypothetical protein
MLFQNIIFFSRCDELKKIKRFIKRTAPSGADREQLNRFYVQTLFFRNATHQRIAYSPSEVSWYEKLEISVRKTTVSDDRHVKKVSHTVLGLCLFHIGSVA